MSIAAFITLYFLYAAAGNVETAAEAPAGGAVIQWPPASCICRELLSSIITGCCRIGFCNIQNDGLRLGEGTRLYDGKYIGHIFLENDRPNNHLHIKLRLSMNMEMTVFSIGKQLFQGTVYNNSTEWQHFAMVLPRFSSKRTVGIILATESNIDSESVNLQMEIFIATTDTLPNICGESLCDNHPNITDVTVALNQTTAVLNCITSHPNLNTIIWFTPEKVTSVRNGTKLIITRLGTEAAGVYLCVATNGISFDRREILFPGINNTLNVTFIGPTSPTPSNSTFIGLISSVSKHTSSSVISHTPSSSASIGQISSAINHTPSSSASIGQISSVISHTPSSSASIGQILSVISHTSPSGAPINPISSDNTNITDLLVMINLSITIILTILVSIILLYITRVPTKLTKLCHCDRKDDDDTTS